MMNNFLHYNKIHVLIDEVVPGMVIAQTLINDFGSVIIYENTILNDYTIKKLKGLGFHKILIYDIEEEEIESNRTHFSIRYDESKELIKDFIKDVGANHPPDMEHIKMISDILTENFGSNREIIETISKIKDVNEYTYTHSINVALLSSILGKWIGLDEITVKQLTQAGLLHDIGKVKISPEILNKPGKLEPEEFEIIKTHPVVGYKMLKDIPNIDRNILLGVLMHHEREDGSGYPINAKSHQIHYFAKIIAIVDIYDAMTSERCYKSRQTPFEVLEMFETESFGTLEPRYRMIFATNIANYYIGDLVRLNTGEIAEIVHINPFHVSKPLLKIDNTYVDLSKEKDLKIVEMVE